MAILMIAGIAGTYPGESTYFQGILWGTVSSGSMKYAGEDTETLDLYYTSPHSIRSLGEATLSRVIYLYNYKYQLYSVIATATEKKNHDAMLQYLTG